jgi:hypothetical protein
VARSAGGGAGGVEENGANSLRLAAIFLRRHSKGSFRHDLGAFELPRREASNVTVIRHRARQSRSVLAELDL